MKNINVVIIDDEEKSRRVLNNLLERLFPDVNVVGQASDVDEGYELIKIKNPDLVFLDIQMPKANGFTLLKKYESIPFEVIFVTSYDKYAITAIKFNALDYLLKPIEISDLKSAIEKTYNIIEFKQNRSPQMLSLLNSVNHEKRQRKVAVHEGDFVNLVDSAGIVYIEAERTYSNIYTLNKEKYMVSRSLKEFEDYLGTNSDFIRIHKSCLLNVQHIKKYSKGEPCIIEMSDGKTFEVARRKKQEILETLKRKE